MYHNLKHGSYERAYCSHISVCPRLQWVGPTAEDLQAAPAAYKDTYRQQRQSANPHWSVAEAATDADKWEKEQHDKIQKKFSRVKVLDRTRVKGWNTLDWLKYDPEVKADVERMLAGKAKFRLADMTVVGVPYLKVFIEGKVNLLSPIKMRKPVTVPPMPQRSSPGRRFARLASQTQTSGAKLASEPTSERSVLEPAVLTEEQMAELLERAL